MSKMDHHCCLQHVNIFHIQQLEQFPWRLLSCNGHVWVCSAVVTVRASQPADESDALPSPSPSYSVCSEDLNGTCKSLYLCIFSPLGSSA